MRAGCVDEAVLRRFSIQHEVRAVKPRWACAQARGLACACLRSNRCCLSLFKPGKVERAATPWCHARQRSLCPLAPGPPLCLTNEGMLRTAPLCRQALHARFPASCFRGHTLMSILCPSHLHARERPLGANNSDMLALPFAHAGVGAACRRSLH